MRRLIALPLLLLVLAPARADTGQQAGSKRLKDIAPFLGADTLAVFHWDLGKLDVDALFQPYAGIVPAKELAKGREEVEKILKKAKGVGVRDVYAVIRLTDLLQARHGPDFFLVVPLPEGADADQVKDALPPDLRREAEKIGKALIVGEPQVRQRLRGLTPVAHPELAKGFAAAGNSAVQVIFLLPKALRCSLNEALPTLPPVLGGGPSTIITEGFSWAAVGVTLKPKMAVKAIIQAKDADAAKALARLYDAAFQAAITAKEPGFQAIQSQLAALKEVLTPNAKGSRLTLTLNHKEIVAILVPAVQKVREAADRAQSLNNLKELALALINYADSHRTVLPAHAIYSKDGKPLLSWRVAILPFVEQQRLYQQFHLDEPWDSPHNKKLIERMPAVFRHPESKAGPGKTVYVVPVGKDTIFPPRPKGIRFPADIPDGTSNTILIVEVDDADAVIWTKPADLRYDPKNPFKGLRGKKTGSFNAAFADGSVRAIRRTIGLPTLRALFTRNGGEVIGNIP
jgi:prepilin-type processing-associated H-X9-DG protein